MQQSLVHNEGMHLPTTALNGSDVVCERGLLLRIEPACGKRRIQHTSISTQALMQSAARPKTPAQALCIYNFELTHPSRLAAHFACMVEKKLSQLYRLNCELILSGTHQRWASQLRSRQERSVKQEKWRVHRAKRAARYGNGG